MNIRFYWWPKRVSRGWQLYGLQMIHFFDLYFFGVVFARNANHKELNSPFYKWESK